MEDILKLMRDRAESLRRAIDKANQDSGPFPEGRLRSSSGNGRDRYFLVTEPGDNIGEYITKDRRNLAVLLARKDYRRKFLEDASAELDFLEHAIRRLSSSNADLAYLNLSKPRKKLITPYILTDDLYAKGWQFRTVRTNPYLTEKKIYETMRGEMVRSKSEAIIANILYELKIPYFYEKSLTLKGGIVRYPDFTLLHARERKEIYLEHFGLLDDEGYLIKNLIKLDEYRENGIFPGDNLIFTYETAEIPLDIRGIKKMLKTIFNS